MFELVKNMSVFRLLIAAILARIGGWIPDEIYLGWRYWLIMGKKLNFNNPTTFNEKINWLKIYNRDVNYPSVVDKFLVKEYVTRIIGKEYIIPTYGIWDCYDGIDFTELPNKFILKSTNGGGGTGVAICRDKKLFDSSDARLRIETSMKMSSDWKFGREWVYRDVKPRIIAEQLLESEDGLDIMDYKFFCFNGIVRCLKVDFNRFSCHQANYYDRQFCLLPFGELVCPPNPSYTILKPKNFELMIKLAEKLALGFPFIRVDLYNVNGKIYFGELTLFPNSGFGKFVPEEWDKKLGDFLELDKIDKCKMT